MKTRNERSLLQGTGIFLGKLLAVVMLLCCVNMTAYAEVYTEPQNEYSNGDILISGFNMFNNDDDIELRFANPCELFVDWTDIEEYDEDENEFFDIENDISYKWYKNDTLIEGAADSFFEVRWPDEGTYKLEILFDDTVIKTIEWETVLGDPAPEALALDVEHDFVVGNYYSFTPTETGIYVIYSDDPNANEDEGGSDPGVYVYNSTFSKLGDNDDGNYAYNFKLTLYLAANKTYYFKNYSRENGDSNIIIEKGQLEDYKVDAYSDYDSSSVSVINKKTTLYVEYEVFKPEIDTEYETINWVQDGTKPVIKWYKLNDNTGNYDLLAGQTGTNLSVEYPNGGYYKCELYIGDTLYSSLTYEITVSNASVANAQITNSAQAIKENVYYKIVPSESDEITFAAIAVAGYDEDDDDYSFTLYDENGKVIGSSYSLNWKYYIKAKKTYYLRYWGPDTTITIDYSEETKSEMAALEAAKKAEAEARKNLETAQQEVAAAKQQVAAAKQEAEAAKASGASSDELKAVNEKLAKTEAELKTAKEELAKAKAEVKRTAVPKKGNLKSVKPGKNLLKITWKKLDGVKGYELQIATDKKFKKNLKTVKLKASKKNTTVKKLKAKTKYYVRIRGYKKVDGVIINGKWSKVLNKKTK